MSAIVAVITEASDPELSRRMAGRLLEDLRHRGSHVTLQASDGVAFGTATGDEPTATLPWMGDGLRVVADARLHNRAELLEVLCVSSRATDAEIIGRAYRRWAFEWPAHVVGEFGAAIWDERRREISLARDAIGVRCLYWTQGDGLGFRCATELRPLARSRRSLKPNWSQMALFLADQYDERNATLVEGVNAVPPAHVVIVGERGVKSHRYWHAAGRESPQRALADYAEEFRSLLELAVRDRVVDAQPTVAVEFSGGLDSTTIAGIAARILHADPSAPRPLGVTLVFPGLACDERPFSRAFARHARIPLLEVDPFEAPNLLFPSHGTSDNDYFHPTLAFKTLQLRRTKRLGARVTLTGLGSDQLAHRIESLETADAIRRFDTTGIASAWRVHGAKQVGRSIGRALLSHRCQRRLEGLVRHEPPFLARSAMRAVEDASHARMQELTALPHRDLTQLEVLRCIEHDLGRSLASLDRLAAREGCEFRHPFVDRRVVELLLAMPHGIVAGTGAEFRKPLLRYAMRDLLPDALLERRTVTNFNSFMIRALLECGEDPRHLVKHGVVRQYRLLDDAGVDEILENPTRNLNLRRFVNWLALEVWLRGIGSLGEDDGRKA